MRPFGRRASDHVDLTDRQREVLEGVSRGLENKEIGGQLGISEQAVKQQVSVLLRKFRVPSRAMLARHAVTMAVIGEASRGTDAPLEYFFDRAPILMAFSRGRSHEIRMVNREFRRVFGERDYVGRTVLECIPAGAGALVTILDRVFEGGWPWRESEQRISFEAPDGTRQVTFLSWVAEPVRDHAGVIEGIAFYAWDVTAQIGARSQLDRRLGEGSASGKPSAAADP